MSFKNPIPNIDDSFGLNTSKAEENYYPKKEVYFAFIDVLGFKKDFEDLKISKEEKKY